MKCLKKAMAVCAVAAVLAPTGVLAETRIQSDIDYRRELMAAMDWNLVRIAQTLRHQRPYDAQRFAAEGRALAALAPLAWVAFVPGSDRGATKASVRIWREPQAFAKAVTRFQAATQALAQATSHAPFSQAARPLEQVASACRSCHHRFMR
ncbi:cytochrome c [Acidiferrobacter sp.]|uniref:cytochrome c n=1 Tax=Acidiferrobacter sp. TaxID=1872107 RepID=UPI00262D41B6|nr:cytochrome c [Acidiferrobacter sp.]